MGYRRDNVIITRYKSYILLLKKTMLHEEAIVTPTMLLYNRDVYKNATEGKCSTCIPLPIRILYAETYLVKDRKIPLIT